MGAEPLRRASEIEPRRVQWLLKPQIPVGKLTAIAGQMGQAKSVLVTYLAAAVTTARGVDLRAPAKVLMWSAEDDPDDTTVPRLIGAGADLDRVAFPGGNTLDADMLSNYCDELGDVALVTIDPVSAFFAGKTDSWKSQDVRRALEPIRVLAQERQLAIVLVQHLNRRSDTSEALSRIADSPILFEASPSSATRPCRQCSAVSLLIGSRRPLRLRAPINGDGHSELG